MKSDFDFLRERMTPSRPFVCSPRLKTSSKGHPTTSPSDRRKMDPPTEEGFDDDNELTFVKEAPEVNGLVEQIKDALEGRDPADGTSTISKTVFHKIQEIVERYQEYPTLLDPHLEGWILPLTSVIRREAHKDSEADMVLVQRASRVLHALASVRGYKTVVKFFPHEAKDFEPVVALLVRSHDVGSLATNIEEADELGSAWETRATLILWLSILVLIPFDLVTVDSQVTTNTGVDGAAMAKSGGQQEAPPVVLRILALCQDSYLRDPGIVRDRAAFLLAKLLTRPDMPLALQKFLVWATDALGGQSEYSEQEKMFIVPGIVRALAATFKLGKRSELLEVAERLWTNARDLADSPAAKASTLTRKLACKLTQRIGLLFLKPRVVSWRYERGARSLEDNLKRAMIISQGGDADAEDRKKAEEEAAKEQEEEEDWDIPEEIEEVIEALLTALRDKDTVVRWSAAKGLGRITARLPAELGDEVVGSILDCFLPTENDNTWHGACLALAELSRRGLLLPVRLPDAVPHVASALAYDVRRGPHSVGAHVRDAASYVCWAFARAYAPEVLAPHADALAPSLLIAACFDREVNCRRAASAAFQESVGRLGAFPHGIDIIQVADYFSLGSRTKAYTVVADHICGYDEYRRRMLNHLCDVKLIHWERATRELAARTISIIGRRDPEWIREVALPVLLDRSLSTNLEARHGACVGAAEALLALKNAGEPCVEGELATKVTGLVTAIEKARLYRGKGGEVMRAAVSKYVQCLASVSQPLDKGPGPATGPKSLRCTLLASLEENLKHPTVDIRDSAVSAIGEFAASYMVGSNPAAGAKRLIVKLATVLRDDQNPAARRGAALALGVMPREMLFSYVPGFAAEAPAEENADAEADPEMIPAWRMALEALKAASIPEEDVEARDVDARVCATKGMAGVLSRMATNLVEDDYAATSQAASEVISSLLTCMEDYCTDNRGDVGSWVREAAMEALPGAISALQASGLELATGRCVTIVSALLKQCAEKIDRTRASAATALCAVLRGRESDMLEPLPDVPGFNRLLDAAPTEERLAASWAVPTSAYAALTPLIVADGSDPLAAYRADLIEGIVVSAGGVGDSLGKASGGALVAAVKADPALQETVANELVDLLPRRRGVDRVTVPLLRVLDLLFSSGALASVAPAHPDPPNAFAHTLAENLRAELKGSRDVAKLCHGVQALSHVAALGPNVINSDRCARTSGLQGILALMVSRYPRVRRVASEALYVLLLGLDEEAACEGIEAAIELLSDTRWDAELTMVKPERNKLYPLLGLEAPAAALEAAKGPGVKVKVVDENESYAALVGSAGY